MERITIKELIDFRRKADKSKRKAFAQKLKTRTAKEKKEEENTGGGDYWITSTSCIYSVFKYGNAALYDSKIDELHERFEEADIKRTKSMHQRNIDILVAFKDFDFTDLKPDTNLKFEKVPKFSKVFTIDSFPLYVNPSLLFSYEINDKKEMGALWLIPRLNGFTKPELGMFCEILYRFMVKNYGGDFHILENYCIAIDTYSAQKVVYSELVNNEIPYLIDRTLEEIQTI